MSDQRKKYTPAEKAKIALDAIKGELTLAQISSKYGVHSSQINAWKKQLLAYLPDAFNDKSKQQALTHNLEVADLYEQIGRLKVENDFLKKNVRCSMVFKHLFWAAKGIIIDRAAFVLLCMSLNMHEV